MAEAAARTSAEALRQERLAALGIEVLSLRARAEAATSEAPSAAAQVAADVPRRLRLVLQGAMPAQEGGEGAALFAAIIATLGLRRDEISFEPIDGVPVLAFGLGDEGAVTRTASLAQLREPHEKRAAWPALRRLRRALRDASADR